MNLAIIVYPILAAAFVGGVIWKGDDVIKAIRWQLSKSGRETRSARKVLVKFYLILHNRENGEEGDQKLVAYLREQGVVIKEGAAEEFDSELSTLIVSLEEKAQVVSPDILHRATFQKPSELRADMETWHHKGMLPCWAIVYFKEDDGPEEFLQEDLRRFRKRHY